MNKHPHNDLTIEVFDDPIYKLDSADNNSNYAKHYLGSGAREFPTSKHGIRIYKEEEEISSCIIIGSGGATGIQEQSSIIENDNILICCCDTVFCLALPDLELKWKTQADQATCFGIYKIQDGFIVHGEIEISRLDNLGNIKWSFGGADIFVSIDGEESFKLEPDHIELTDFYNRKYKIDFEGNPIQ
ncbi:hypothetical protein ACD591_06040 [Rufibacter glacialis]|uniref:Uncharacterized protein n=1 Tax=Rufibacter glacialis TaxID=1259555 RepID=A0A5M8QFM2_9BACT|nr:hypothetical protein [Rufibacter glacialis]KAA6433222.1 hypothetical protein FOE74_12090 [Rufibacter glacialis]GGK76334.1 hypothetical protein GCM10011405_25220 [Rufibacter glacialis]